MAIHHNTLKRAEKNAVVLSEIDEELFEATIADHGVAITNSDPKMALDAALLAKTLKVEYAVELTNEDDETLIAHVDVNNGSIEIGTYEFIPELADVLDDMQAAIEEHASEADFEDDEERAPASVVPDIYRQIYAERGNADHCGDWLALTFENAFVKYDGSFDLDAFLNVCYLNGVEGGKWSCATGRGANGRIRMNGRQKLEVRVAFNGHVVMPGFTLEVPAQVLYGLRDKHAKAIIKLAKASA